MAVGAVAGTFAGGAWDMSRAGVNADFLDEVSTKLSPGKWAVVSQISEEWVTPVDTRWERLAAPYFEPREGDFEHEEYAKDVAAIKADIAQLKAEQAKSRADQKAKLQLKIDNLNKKLNNKLEQAKQRSKQQEKEAKAKVEALEKKAAKAKGETKAKIETRIYDIKEKYKRDEEAFEGWSKKNEEDIEEWMTGEANA